MNRRTHLKLFAQDCKEWLGEKLSSSSRKRHPRARARRHTYRNSNDPAQPPHGGRPPRL